MTNFDPSKIINITFNDELVRMNSALIAGKETAGTHTSMYVGPLNLNELHNTLFLINTGVLKILTQELDIDLDDCDDFLLSAISEAITYEWNVQRGKANAPRVVKYRTE
jgi:hypothetical protein